MADKDTFLHHFRKCQFCIGKDGKRKDVYDTVESAIETAKYLKQERNIDLTVYNCPFGSGFHLTKNNADSELLHDRKQLFRKTGIPLESANGSWEFIRANDDEFDEDLDEDDFKGKTAKPQKANKQAIPIKKIECKAETKPRTIFGKIMEIVKDVDIEKMFKINLDNPFCAKMVKGTLDGIICQFTIYAENPKGDQLESYTVLAKKELLDKHKITKGQQIKLCVSGKSISRNYFWYCGVVGMAGI